MKRKDSIISKNFYTIVTYLLLIFILQSCPNLKDNDIYIDCVPNIDINEFQFYGNYQTDIELYTRDIILDTVTMEADSEEIPVEGTAKITFNEDNTFELSLTIACDSVNSALPICTLVDYNAGTIELHLTGTWNFTQEFETQYQASGYGEMIHLNTIRGNCLMTILNSNNEEFNGKVLNASINLWCLQNSPNNYYLDFEVYFTALDRIYLQFSKQ